MAFGKETLTSPFAYSHQESLHNGGKQNTAGQRAKPEETLEHLKQQRVEECKSRTITGLNTNLQCKQ